MERQRREKAAAHCETFSRTMVTAVVFRLFASDGVVLPAAAAAAAAVAEAAVAGAWVRASRLVYSECETNKMERSVEEDGKSVKAQNYQAVFPCIFRVVHQALL